MKLSGKQVRTLTSAAFYALMLVCYAVHPPEAIGTIPAILISAALQILLSINSRQWNSLAFALTLMPSGAMASGLAACPAPLQFSFLLPGFIAAVIVRIINSLKRWPDSRPATLHWVGAAAVMMTFAATAAILLQA